MAFTTLRYEVDHNVLTITLNRPDQLNAFNLDMADELVRAIQQADADEDVRAIVVTGAGKAFCAGMDLSREGNVFGLNEDLKPDLTDMQERLDDPDIVSGVRDTGGQLALAIFECRKPVIAAINGAAVGIGATMTCAMDIRLASDKARVGFVFNKIGITPEACSTWFLPRIVSMGTALEWLYTGDLINSDELLNKGFVNRVIAADQLLAEAQKLARRLAGNSPVAMALTRQMLYRNAAQPHPLSAHQVDSLAIFYTSQTSGKEGVQAFLDKRPPRFSDRLDQDLPPFYPWW
ncbi:MAG: crotonase/enoyl-CoA hydratase family protein [Pseudohongiellaceae bacterium]|jgi:enoyl-CoA hydratase/carnithine racemase